MSQTFLLNCAQQEALLVDAVSRRHPIELSCNMSDGWAQFRSRLLAAEPGPRELVIEYPWRDSTYMLEFGGGESLGVSFRRSHRKCVFETVVLGVCRFSSRLLKEVPALRLAWPKEIHELQRRMYYRAPVPENLNIPVEIGGAGPAVDNPQGPARYTGRLYDLSAGGMSVGVPRGHHPRWQLDTVVECSFVPDDGDAPLECVGRVRYVDARGSDRMQIGVQFAGLEMAGAGRATLQRLLGVCSRFQEVEMRRLKSL